jgi:fimbrial chaperone protein
MRRRTVIAGLAAQALILVGQARAEAKLGVAPTLVDLASDEANSVLFVSNGGDEALMAQLRLFDWRNEGGEERYSPAADVAFSPGQFSVPAGGRQIVRIARLALPGPVERAYRLVVDQLPVASATGTLRMTVRMLVPVFVAPAGPMSRTPPTLTWACVVDRASHTATLTVSNPGRRRVRLTELAYAAGGAPLALYEGLAGYVLAAGGWSCRFRLVGEPVSIDVSALTEDGRIRASVPLIYR